VLISVKSGKVDSQKVRDLRGVVEREKSAIGLMITLQKPTKDMKTEATEAKLYTSPWGGIHVSRFLLEELLGGKQVDAIKPGGSTFKAAKRVSEKVCLGEMQQSFSISLSRTLMTAS